MVLLRCGIWRCALSVVTLVRGEVFPFPKCIVCAGRGNIVGVGWDIRVPPTRLFLETVSSSWRNRGVRVYRLRHGALLTLMGVGRCDHGLGTLPASFAWRCCMFRLARLGSMLEANDHFWFSSFTVWFWSPGISGKVIRRIDDTAVIPDDRAYIAKFLYLTLACCL